MKIFNKTRQFFSLMALTIALTGCGHSSGDGGEANEPATTGSDSGSNALTLTRHQVIVADIGFGTITRERLSRDIKAKGRLILPPGSDALVGSQIEGTVSSIRVKGGDRIRKGEVLATLISPYILQIQQEYLSVRSQRQLLKGEFERQSLLHRDKINADKAWEEALHALNDNAARYQSLRMQMELLHFPLAKLDSGMIMPEMEILSFLDGQVERVFIRVGERVDSSNPMFRVINKRRLLVELRVFEKDIPYIHPGQRVTFELANMGSEVFEARVISIGQVLEEDVHTLQVMAEFRNHSPYIIPGMFASARIHTDEAIREALPEEAVVEDAGIPPHLFYTLSADTDSLLSFHKVRVQTGFMEDGFIQVTLLDTLPADARVVIRGSYFLKSQGED